MPEPKPRLDRDARREAILDVARDVFLEEGYANASMSTIAARVGGSKGTLYNYFKNKDELFTAYVVRHCVWQREAMWDLAAGQNDIRTALSALGRAYLSIVLSDSNMRNLRLIVAEAQRTPHIGKTFYDAGPKAGAERLATILMRGIERGELEIDDPVRAAFQFIGLCKSRFLTARLCNAIPEPTEDEIAAEVDAAVESFLRANGPAR